MRTLKYAAVAIVAIVLLLFCFANRHTVIISFDPFGTRADAAFSIEAPLFVVAIAFTMLGVVAGAFATWVRQGRYRKANRTNRAEAAKWKAQAEALKSVHPDPRALPRG